jgi:hypothetical protein
VSLGHHLPETRKIPVAILLQRFCGISKKKSVESVGLKGLKGLEIRGLIGLRGQKGPVEPIEMDIKLRSKRLQIRILPWAHGKQP